MSHSGLKITMTKYNQFPAGEHNVQVHEGWLAMSDKFTIDAKEHDFEIMRIAQYVDIVRRNKKNAYITLKMMYMPYGRQDRAMGSENFKGSNSLKVFANLINTLDIDEIVTYDPHSDVTEAVFDNLTIQTNQSLVTHALNTTEHNTKFIQKHIVIPDVGASKKIYPLVKSLPWNMRQNITLHQCEKHRDTTNGQITHSSLPETLTSLPENTTVFLIDDLCDGGLSFTKIAEQAPHLDWNLVVSHGIFSKGLDPLLEHFSKIFTTDSFKQTENEKLEVFRL